MNYDILVRKICNYDLPIDCSTFIMFDSFDGANHLETVEGKIDLVSFNSTLINSDLVNQLKGYSTSRSSGILTWMQVAAKEEPYMLLSMLESYYQERTKVIEEQKKLNINIHYYDVHDRKILYGLT